MKKVLTVTLVLAIILFLNASSPTYAEIKNFNINPFKHISSFSNLFLSNSLGKEKEQERVKNNKFMIKGVITASSSSSLTIKNQLINIDSSVTGNVKIIGNLSVGMYAMVQGIIKDSNYYAAKIVVNQRNKKEVEENDNDENEQENITPTVTVTPTIIVTPTETPTPTPEGTQSATILGESEKGGVNINFNMRTLLEAIHDLLTSFRSVLLSV